MDTNIIGIEIKRALHQNTTNFNYDTCFERKERGKERETQRILFDIGATAPAITINDIGLKCFEKERKEVYGFEYGAPTGAVDTTFNNNIGRFFKAPGPIGAVTTTLVWSTVRCIFDNL